MAKSSRKSVSRAAPKASGTSQSAPKSGARAGGGSGTGASRRGAAGSSGASRWSRGKPAATRKVASSGPKRVAPAPLAIRDPSQEEIAHHAYHRWLKHGGSEHENWYAAEHELRTRRSALRASRTPKGGT